MSELVRLAEVSHAYGTTRTIHDVSLSIGSDDLVGIVGPSGAGKTTLLHLVSGALRPTAGTITRRDGLKLGYVPQVDTVDWAFPVTVADCVLMARTTGRRLPWPSRAERSEVAALLDRLGIGGLERRHIRELSGGQQQRVFIARAMLSRPHLLVLDEPTSGVDVRTRHDIVHLLAELHAEGLAVVVTTHDLNGIAAHLPRLVCLATRVIADGAPAAVMTSTVLEQLYGAPIEIIEHAGLPVVLDRIPTAAHSHD